MTYQILISIPPFLSVRVQLINIIVERKSMKWAWERWRWIVFVRVVQNDNQCQGIGVMHCVCV